MLKFSGVQTTQERAESFERAYALKGKLSRTWGKDKETAVYGKLKLKVHVDKERLANQLSDVLAKIDSVLRNYSDTLNYSEVGLMISSVSKLNNFSSLSDARAYIKDNSNDGILLKIAVKRGKETIDMTVKDIRELQKLFREFYRLRATEAALAKSDTDWYVTEFYKVVPSLDPRFDDKYELAISAVIGDSDAGKLAKKRLSAYMDFMFTTYDAEQISFMSSGTALDITGCASKEIVDKIVYYITERDSFTTSFESAGIDLDEEPIVVCVSVKPLFSSDIPRVFYDFESSGVYNYLMED